MPLCLVVTRDVEPRYRGFLGSVMLELAPGVYAGPRMTKAVRERVWRVLSEWHGELGRGSLVMTWRDAGAPGGLRVLTRGEPPKDLVETDGFLLVRRPLRAAAAEPRDPGEPGRRARPDEAGGGTGSPTA